MTYQERKQENREYRLLVKQSEVPKPPLIIRWYALWHTPLKEHWHNFYMAIKPYLTLKMALCFGLSWCIVDGSPYLMVIFGNIYHLPLMVTIGLAIESVLWFPLTLEKPLIVIPLGVWFYRLFFHATIDKKKLLK